MLGFPWDPRITIGACQSTRGRAGSRQRATSCCGVQVGVAAGWWIGDLDVDAFERHSSGGVAWTCGTLLNFGFVIGANDFAPFDSQNTAWRRDAAPLMCVLPGIGRYDDIWGSYIAQRAMWEMGIHLSFGQPFVLHERNPQDPIENMIEELHGLKYSRRLCDDLRRIKL